MVHAFVRAASRGTNVRRVRPSQALSLRPFPLNPAFVYTIIPCREERIGSVIRFFEKESFAAVELGFGDLSVGDTSRIKGNATDFARKVDAMAFDHTPVNKAIRGQFTGIKLSRPARPFDLDYKVKG